MIKDNVVLGKGVAIYHPQLVKLYGCIIGENFKIGTFVKIQKAASAVTRDMPDYAIVAGVPARVVGEGRETVTSFA
jgi:acetyltransferase-like isoleucine patch superfamily enzyme